MRAYGWRALVAAASITFTPGPVSPATIACCSARRCCSTVARWELRDSTTVLQQRLAEQQAIVAGLTGPGVKVIDAAATSARQPYARMFWDQPANRWTFVAYNLPAATPGHTYQLWLITRDQK